MNSSLPPPTQCHLFFYLNDFWVYILFPPVFYIFLLSLYYAFTSSYFLCLICFSLSILLLPSMHTTTDRDEVWKRLNHTKQRQEKSSFKHSLVITLQRAPWHSPTEVAWTDLLCLTKHQNYHYSQVMMLLPRWESPLSLQVNSFSLGSCKVVQYTIKNLQIVK